MIRSSYEIVQHKLCTEMFATEKVFSWRGTKNSRRYGTNRSILKRDERSLSQKFKLL